MVFVCAAGSTGSTPARRRASKDSRNQFCSDPTGDKRTVLAPHRGTGALILSGRFVDDPIKEKSRYCTREFATKKDPTVFAAANDVNNSAVVDLLAVKKADHGV